MPYRLGVEDVEPNHWVAHVFELAGCFSSAHTQDEAIRKAPERIAAHSEWLSRHGRMKFPTHDARDVRVAEVFQSFRSVPNYIVNAFFEHDRRPLARDDVDEALWLLDCARLDLLNTIEQIPAEQLGQPLAADPKSSIARILDHIAWAEWWYFDRLNLSFARGDMPAEPLAKLEKVRAQTIAQLPWLIGDERIVERSGEHWSARKVLRRTLWHERDHTQQIEKLTHEPV